MTDFLDTIVAKSDQLNAVDLVAGPITVSIVSVERSQAKEQPMVIHITGHQPYKPCLSMRRILLHEDTGWGLDTSQWAGRRLTLYNDPDVTYGNHKTGGIRISHMSHIAGPLAITLPLKRNRYSVFHVQPLPDLPYPQEMFDKHFPAWQEAIKSGKESADTLISKVETKGQLSAAQKEQIRNLTNTGDTNANEHQERPEGHQGNQTRTPAT